ncbi:MAG: hypothetical protein QNK37_35100 [Acidobacteriota bacterium]|nr:hypothetical protein [Acidobacteriota bacterium]
MRETLIEARSAPSKIRECKVGLRTLCPVRDERIPKDQQAKLCTEKTARGLTAYRVCRNCCRELEKQAGMTTGTLFLLNITSLGCILQI